MTRFPAAVVVRLLNCGKTSQLNNSSVMSGRCLRIRRTFIRPEINDPQILLQLLAALLKMH